MKEVQIIEKSKKWFGFLLLQKIFIRMESLWCDSFINKRGCLVISFDG